MGVFSPKDRTYRAFFVLLHKEFFSDGPKGIECIGSFVHAAESTS